MTTQPSAALAKRFAQSERVVSSDKLEKVRELVDQARDFEKEIEDLEERLNNKRKELHALYHETIPAIMSDIGTDRVGLPPKGNLPGVDVKLQRFYSANIAAAWPEEKRQAAFQVLEKTGNGDLIKTQLIFSFPREERKKAVAAYKAFMKQYKKAGGEVRESVHSGTLKAWLKDQVESGKFLSQETLEAIGGTVGHIAVLKERKE